MSDYLGTVKGLGVGFIVALLMAVLYLSGCASRPERKCVGDTCFIRASAEQVNRRCTKGKKTWDDGTPYDATASKTARCCAVFRPSYWSKHKRFSVWVAEGQEECLVHELCHLEIYKADGYIFFPERHKACHDFGLGKPKGRPA